MLQLINVCKSYTTADFTQTALDHVSVAFRDNEFVAVLGPSGSGKTTMLNIIGGLDHYDDGDLLIDGVSTSEYKDRDWDAYRNNRIGFVFQSLQPYPTPDHSGERRAGPHAFRRRPAPSAGSAPSRRSSRVGLGRAREQKA